MTLTLEDYESRSDEMADRTRSHLAALNTGGIAVTFAVAGALTAKDVSPFWTFWPVLIFTAGLIVTAGSLLLGKHKALKRRDAKRSEDPEPDFSAWYWRNFTYEIAATLLFVVAVLVGLLTLRLLSLPGTPGIFTSAARIGGGNMPSIWDGVLIGGAGGAVAGVTVWLVQLAHSKFTESRDKERVYTWLKANTADEDGNAFRSTRAIASWTNLTEDRVRYICSVHGQIYLSTGKEDDMWSLYEVRSR